MGLYKGKRTFSGLREEVTTDKEGALPAGSVVIIGRASLAQLFKIKLD